MTRQRHPRGLASRFFLAQAIVVAAGILAAVAVASSVLSFDSLSFCFAIVPGKWRTLRRATYCSSRWFFFRRLRRCSSASASASVSTAGLPEAIALTSA